VNAAVLRLAAEARAVEQGHVARADGLRSYRVRSDTVEGSWRVEWRPLGEWILFACTCPAGVNHTFCKHVALVGRRLERDRIAVWRDGWWWLRESECHPMPADIFEGL
jgi:uncharacterized Zn finger protein